MAVTLTDAARARRPAAPRLPVGIAGLGIAVPREIVTNEDWARILETSDEWITSRTGIRERRRAAADEATSDLAARAAKAALDDAGLSAADVDALLVATTTPDHLIPQTAPIVAARLGSQANAFDVGAGCTGFVVGLAVGAGLLAAGLADRVLLVGAEVMTKVVDPEDRHSAVLFGDGAGACVLAADAGELGPFDFGTDGEHAELLIVPAGGTRRPATEETVAAREHYLRMQGREVYRHAVARMTASSRAVLTAAELEPADIDLLVGHQANARILEAVGNRAGIEPFLAIERYGNTSAASIPLALADARERGRLQPGARVLLTAFGAGLVWGSCLLTWGGSR